MHVWPHLLVVEFVATLAMTAFLLIFSAFVNAPLLAAANFNLTPNPSKAPWYFLGLQELLTMFHPMVAGVTIPGMGIFVLMVAAATSTATPSNKPEDRKFAIAILTIFMMFWAVLVIIGSFFRGRGLQLHLPVAPGRLLRPVSELERWIPAPSSVVVAGRAWLVLDGVPSLFATARRPGCRAGRSSSHERRRGTRPLTATPTEASTAALRWSPAEAARRPASPVEELSRRAVALERAPC